MPLIESLFDTFYSERSPIEFPRPSFVMVFPRPSLVMACYAYSVLSRSSRFSSVDGRAGSRPSSDESDQMDKHLVGSRSQMGHGPGLPESQVSACHLEYYSQPVSPSS